MIPSQTVLRRRIWLRSFATRPPVYLDGLTKVLSDSGIEVNSYAPGQNARGPGLVIIDNSSTQVCTFIQAASHAGAEQLLVLANNNADLPGESVWRLLQAGAADILVWEDLADPAAVVARRLERWNAIDAILESPLVKNNLVGNSKAWITVLRQIIEAAHFTDNPILLMGETGTGKELAARLIHSIDPKRSKHDLVVVDCSTIVPDLSGSELFGHEKGAFTGAVNTRDGAFALADQGSLFLDEIGELPVNLQTQLLRGIQENTYKRVGSNSWQKTNFRLICATNRDLVEEINHGKFRSDLYYRIASWSFRLPPLRERLDDLERLTYHFIKQTYADREPPLIDSRVWIYLRQRAYPGNVRDLRNLVLRILSRHVDPGMITLGDIPPDERMGFVQADPAENIEPAIRDALAGGMEYKDLVECVQAIAKRVAVEDAGDLRSAAQRLGLSIRTMQGWKKSQS